MQLGMMEDSWTLVVLNGNFGLDHIEQQHQNAKLNLQEEQIELVRLSAGDV